MFRTHAGRLVVVFLLAVLIPVWESMAATDLHEQPGRSFGQSAAPARPEEIFSLPIQKGVTDVDVIPDRELLVSSGDDGSIFVRGEGDAVYPRFSLRHGIGPVNSAISPDGTLLATGASDGTVRIWSLDDLEAEPHEFPAVAPPSNLHLDVTIVAFTPDGQSLIAGGSDGVIRIWDTTELASDPVVIEHDTPVWTLAVSPDGSDLATGDNEGAVRIWDLVDPALPPELPGGHTQGIKEIAYSPDGSLLASSSYDATVRVWSTSRLDTDPVVLEHPYDVYALAFSPDGATLAAGGAFDGVYLWTVDDLDEEPVVVITPSSPSVRSLTFAPGGETLAAGLGDGRIASWDAMAQDEQPHVTGISSQLESVGLSPDGQTLATDSGPTFLWQVNTPGAMPVALRISDYPPMVALSLTQSSMAFDTLGRRLVVADGRGEVLCWNLERPDDPPLVWTSNGDGEVVAISPDGSHVASADATSAIQVWDVERPDAPPVMLSGHEESIFGIAFSPDGNLVAAGAADGAVLVWDLSAPAAPSHVFHHAAGVSALAFAPDSARLAVGDWNGAITIRDLERPAADPVELLADGRQLRQLSFNIDGSMVLAGSVDMNKSLVQLWDVEGARVVLSVPFDVYLPVVQFSPDGSQLLVVTRFGAVWKIET